MTATSNKPAISKGTTQEQAQRELARIVARTGHSIKVPKCVTGNWSGECPACGKVVVVRFDVPCGWLVVGSGAGGACHVSGRGW